MIHLQEVQHTGEYLARILKAITDDLECTNAVFTVTRDNASSNDVMLREFERLTQPTATTTTRYPTHFTCNIGDIRCIAHIINLAAQEMVKQLKVEPSDSESAYAYEYGKAEVIPTSEGVISTLTKVRHLIYTFRNRRIFREELQERCKREALPYKQLKFDMPVRWNSTALMLSSFLHLRTPISYVLSAQKIDLSLRHFKLRDSEWDILQDLCSCFKIFVKITEQMQSESKPTLNWVIPHYLSMIRKLDKQETYFGMDSPIGWRVCVHL